MPARRYRSVIVIVAAASALAGAQASAAGPADTPLSHESAARFFLAEVADKVQGDWEQAWASLYPPHQRVAPRAVFVRCEQVLPFAAPLESLHVVGVRAAAVRVEGSARPVPGVAVVAAVELRWFGPRDPIVFRHTFHLVPVDGRWTWLLSPARYRFYARGGCSAARLSSPLVG